MNTTSRNFFILGMSIVLVFGLTAPMIASAEMDKIDPEKLVEQAKTAYTDNVGPKTKNFITKTFASIEAFRIKTATQLTEKRDAKAAVYKELKREQVHELTTNTEQFLNGEQQTLSDGASDRIGT